jgi:hypothetical protein
MHLVSATSSELLYSVVNSACLSERDRDDMNRHRQHRNGERLADFNETLKALASALFPIAGSGD